MSLEENIVDPTISEEVAEDPYLVEDTIEEGDGLLVEPEEGAAEPEAIEAESKVDESAKQRLIEKEEVQKRFNQLTGEKFKWKNEAETNKREKEALLAELATLRANPAVGGGNAEVERLAGIRAKELVAEEMAKAQYASSLQNVWDKGIKEFPEFGEAVDRLGQLGVTATNAMPTINKLPDAHKVIVHLSNDLENAARVLSLPSEERAIELTRLENTLNNKRPDPTIVSKAPAPIKPIDAAARPKVSLADEKISIDEWLRLRNKQVKERGKK